MTYEEMAKSFLEARDKGFVGDVNNPTDCNSKCEECPAYKACGILSEDNSLTTFCSNYRELIMPLFETI